MKRLLCLTLSAVFLLLPCRRASAPVSVGLGLALKCVGIGVIIPTAIIIYKCDQDYYLVRYQDEGEDPWWDCSKANTATLKKQNGRRCEGPFPSPEEPKARAWANNQLPGNPPFPCGPLGKIPSPDTNALRIVLEMSANAGSSWTPIASTLADPSDNLSVAVFLSSAGSSGMSPDQLRAVADCDLAVTNTSAVTSATFRWVSSTPIP